ncbi:MAG: hypothetical protein GY904_35790 [Planctomycetaceae bacterium]|nr:hypothetical protein [Planctomycetaceae bacterium]
MKSNFLPMAIVLIALCSFLQSSILRADEGPAPNGVRAETQPGRTKYLLLDSRIVESTRNAKLTVGTVKKHADNPLFLEDKPWEPRFDNVYANVIYDEQERLFKCWYSPFVTDSAHTNTSRDDRKPGQYIARLGATGSDRKMGVCYATSKDGIDWTKPLMDIRLWEGDQRTNIVDIGPHGSGILKDLREADPKRRYKMFMKDRVMAVEFSADGLHWTDPIPCPEVDAAGDTHNNAFWAPELGRYVGITRLWNKDTRQRVVGRTESRDFVNWTKAIEVFRGDPSRQIYAMPVFRYAGVYIGLPVIFQPNTDRSHTELAWSPDTIHWQRIDPGVPLIPTSSKRGDYDWGCVYGAACPIVLDDEIRLYYGASNGPHTDWRDGFLALATLRPDGFAGYETVRSGEPAVVTTTPFSNLPGTLKITADAAGGAVRVAVLDASGKTLAISKAIREDVTDRPVLFPPGFDLAGCNELVRLQFRCESSRLYAFSF